MAPNRVLDLDELESREYRTILNALDALVATDDVSYLHPSKRWEYPWALSRTRLTAGARVLDAGCGDSIFPVYLARNGYSVAGVDLHLSGALASLHEVPIHYARGDLTHLPHPDGCFDAVFCISVIEHLADERIPVAIQELRRVLAPGGMLLLTTDFYHDASADLWYEGPGTPFPVDWGFFDEARLRSVLLDAPGLRLDGDLDLRVDWGATERRMRAFHGYPYTSVGLAFRREN